MAVGDFNGDGIDGMALISILLMGNVNVFSRNRASNNINTHTYNMLCITLGMNS